MSKYRWSCPHCRAPLTIEAAQAGVLLTCACGKHIEVPPYRDLQALERIDEPVPVSGSGWGPRQGLFFVGIVTFLSGIAAAAILWTSIPVYEPPKIETELVHLEMQSKSLRDSFSAFRDLRDRPLSDEPDPFLLAWRHLRDERVQWACVGLALAAIGLVLIGSGWGFPAAPAPAKK